MRLWVVVAPVAWETNRGSGAARQGWTEGLRHVSQDLDSVLQENRLAMRRLDRVR